MCSDMDIIVGIKQGDNEAYRSLYKYHYSVLCTFAYEYVQDKFIAETIVNDVIFSIWLNREILDIKSSLRNYLLKSVKNRCLNYILQLERQDNLRQHISEVNAVDETENFNNPITSLIAKELESKIKDCIDSLPELTKKIFCLIRFNNLKYEEAAFEINVSIDVVKYHMKSALSYLRENLKEYIK
jgi:RNA polymerase sigma-70 factor (ECF subfamily)